MSTSSNPIGESYGTLKALINQALGEMEHDSANEWVDAWCQRVNRSIEFSRINNIGRARREQKPVGLYEEIKAWSTLNGTWNIRIDANVHQIMRAAFGVDWKHM